MNGSCFAAVFLRPFSVSKLRKDDVSMRNVLFYKSKLNLEEMKFKYT